MLRQKASLHPALPQQIKASEKKRWKKVFSDHVPIYSTVPFPENRNLTEIKMISWNVLDHDSSNALAKGKRDHCGETKEQEAARHSRIAESLEKMVQNQTAHLITLQEAGDPELLKKIMDRLGNDWAIAPNQDHSSITLYNKNYFDSAKRIEPLQAGVGSILGPNINELKLKNSNQSVMVCNCHANYSLRGRKHKMAIDSALSQGSDQKKVIVAGDFNTTCLATDKNLSNIATAATPSKYSGDGKQGTNSLDACYHSSMQNNQVSLHQATTIQMNPITGTPYSPEELLKPLANLDKKMKKNHVEKMRMAINIGNELNNSLTINGMTLANYDTFLRKSLPLDSVILLPEGTDRKTAKDLLPGVAYLTKQNGQIYIDIASPTRKFLGKPAPLENIEALSLQFPKSGEMPVEIKMGDHQQLFDQIKKQKPNWESPLYVCEATNMKNERGIGVEVPDNIFAFLQDPKRSSNFEFTTNAESDTDRYNIVCCRQENIAQLHSALQDYINLQPKMQAHPAVKQAPLAVPQPAVTVVLPPPPPPISAAILTDPAKFAKPASLPPLPPVASAHDKVAQQTPTPPATQSVTTATTQREMPVSPMIPVAESQVKQEIKPTKQDKKGDSAHIFKELAKHVLHSVNPKRILKNIKVNIENKVMQEKPMGISIAEAKKQMADRTAKTQATTKSSSEYEYLLKFNVYGAKNAGVNNLISRLTDNTYNPSEIRVTGSDFSIKTIDAYGENTKLQVWDQGDKDESHKTIKSAYSRGEHGIIIAVDLTDENALHDAKAKIEKALTTASKFSPILIVGTNSDEVKNRKITAEALKKFAKDMNEEHSRSFGSAECSVKTGTGVCEAFQKLADHVVKNIKNDTTETTEMIADTHSTKKEEPAAPRLH